MISMHLHEAAACVNGSVQGSDPVFYGCGTDTRKLQKGELFIALRGEHFDGHTFIDQAIQTGASAAMVESIAERNIPVIVVENCRRAMNDLAHHWRKQFAIPVVAITGSNGKTTVKELVTAILSISGPVLSTRGNLNNEIGVPLTLFGLGEEHHSAVIEMGANHAGEIAGLSRTASPDVAVITQCAPAHLEGFGSIEGVAAAKAEIYSGLADDGVAIINLDDNFSDYWLNKTTHLRQISFGLTDKADVHATGLQPDRSSGCYCFNLHTPSGIIQVSLGLPGKHNLQNALAAAACAVALDIDTETVQQGLESFRGVPGRLQMKTGVGNCRIIDDSYNANPGSLRAGLDVLAGLKGRHWLVLGDMGELGADSDRLHHEAGELARESGVERLYGIGPLSLAAVNGFGEGARHFEDMKRLAATLLDDINDDVAVLIKGSRTMRMEQLVAALTGEQN